MKRTTSPWAWVPTLYFAEGLPYIAVNTLSVIMYKKMGMSNTDLAFFTGWLYLPWVIKPFWSPFVDPMKTKRWWTVAMQAFVALAFAAVALALPMASYVKITLVVFWLIAFASATQDIAADGYYMHALDEKNQSLFVGIRSTFYRCATIFGQGVLVILAGTLEERGDGVAKAWSWTFAVLSLFFLALTCYHFYVLPCPDSDKPSREGTNDVKSILKGFGETFVTFFKKSDVWIALLFIVLYRLPEAQLVKILNPFLLDDVAVGGLGLTTAQVGVAYGTVGIIGLTLGGILGGIVISRRGLRRCLFPMALCITLPDVLYLVLSLIHPDVTQFIHLAMVNACVFVEQFGYGVGFTSFTLYMMHFAQGESKTSHFAICTGFMALGMMVPGMFSGMIQERLGYSGFFWWIMGCCLVTLAVTLLVKSRVRDTEE